MMRRPGCVTGFKHILIGNGTVPFCTFTAKSQLTEVIVRDPN